MDKDILSRYNSPEGVTDYSRKFERHWTERVNNWHEQRLLRRLLRSVSLGKFDGLALDLPCGYGRLYSILHDLGASVVEGDWSFHLLGAARIFHADHAGKRNLAPPAGYVRATALCLPFRDRAFELVLSVRLCHHIREPQERLHYLLEIMRVSRKWVVFTYFDTASIKNRTHEFRRRANGKRSKWTLHAQEVKEVSQSAGFEVIQSIWISRFFSGHRYVLLRRTDSAPARLPDRS
ncbi:MAG TPA: methyltransferase domain-containing protein [Candidatus Binatia bacterium]|nr:methyltransferase domain-containing protein [Candidatus Binatia bacterium]